jgi:Zn-dependent oligopeptidase
VFDCKQFVASMSSRFCWCLSLNELLTSFQELEKLSQKFSENVLDATKKFEKLITDKKEIEGLPATALGLAAQTAVSKVGTITTHTNPNMLFPSFLVYIY